MKMVLSFLPQIDDVTGEENNSEEAKIAADRAFEFIKQGYEVAILTPFRKLVNCIREYTTELFGRNKMLDKIPLIDTVERLQGQDVDVIIISTFVNNVSYYQQIKGFILEPYRLNVMFSRAKDKAMVVKKQHH